MNRRLSNIDLTLTYLSLLLGMSLMAGSFCFLAYDSLCVPGWSHKSGQVAVDQNESDGTRLSLGGKRISSPGSTLSAYYRLRDPARSRAKSSFLQWLVAGIIGAMLAVTAGIRVAQKLRLRSRDTLSPYDVVNHVVWQ